MNDSDQRIEQKISNIMNILIDPPMNSNNRRQIITKEIQYKTCMQISKPNITDHKYRTNNETDKNK